MDLVCYFDGANKPTQEHDRVVLSTTCGTIGQWEKFNSDWNDLLENYPAPPLHTKDAVSLKGDFSPDRGWDRSRADDFITSAVRIIDKHIACPFGHGGFISGLHIATLTIPLDDYRRAREIVSLPNSINDLLTSESLGFCFAWGRQIGADNYQLYFDQGEPFRGYAIDRKQNEKARKDVPLLENLTIFPGADSAVTPPLQLADLVAWCISHNDKTTHWWHRVLNDLPWRSAILPYEYLINPTPGALERTSSWNMPRRGVQPNPSEASLRHEGKLNPTTAQVSANH